MSSFSTTIHRNRPFYDNEWQQTTYRARGLNTLGGDAIWIDEGYKNSWEKLPPIPGDLHEFIYYARSYKTIKKSLNIDIGILKTRLVICSFEDHSTDDMKNPVKLDDPSPHLEKLCLINVQVTQTFLETVLACPNLRSVIITQKNPVDCDPITHIPAPANKAKMETWAFDVPSVTSVDDWDAPLLESLVVANAGIDHIPSGLMQSRGLALIGAWGNQIGHEAAENVLLRAGDMDIPVLVLLNDNLIEEIPRPVGKFSEYLCYHHQHLVFDSRQKCECIFYKKYHSHDTPDGLFRTTPMIVGDDHAIPEAIIPIEQLSSISEPRGNIRTIILDDNPLLSHSYPNLRGSSSPSNVSNSSYDYYKLVKKN